MDFRWKFLLSSSMLAIVAAGCATPQEAIDGAANATPDDGSRGGATPEYIQVDGSVYECDDTFDFDGVCDGYELDGSDGASGAQVIMAGVGDRISVGGHSFTCEDQDVVDVGIAGQTPTQGKCARYDRDE